MDHPGNIFHPRLTELKDLEAHRRKFFKSISLRILETILKFFNDTSQSFPSKGKEHLSFLQKIKKSRLLEFIFNLTMNLVLVDGCSLIKMKEVGFISNNPEFRGWN